MLRAQSTLMITRYKDLDTWKLAEDFKLEVFRLVRGSQAARTDWEFRKQLVKSARAVPKDIAEGFVRKAPLTFANFITYGLASLAEAEDHVKDGIQLDYFDEKDCTEALSLAKRCTRAASRLRATQYRYAAQQDSSTPPRRPRAPRR